MAYEMRPGTFSIFPNDKKTKDTQPDWKGSIKLPNGEEYWFDAWNKQGTKGGFISGKIGNPKNSQVNAPASFNTFPSQTVSSDDDVPF
jgi:hypothetical protein